MKKKNDKPVNLVDFFADSSELILPVSLGTLYTPEGITQAISVDSAHFFTIELVEENGEKYINCVAKSL